MDRYRYDLAGGPRDRSLRVGDKERDAASEILQRAHAEGRLDEDAGTAHDPTERASRCGPATNA